MAAVEENILDDLLHQNHEDDALFDEEDKKGKRDDDKTSDGDEEKPVKEDHSDISTDDESRHERDVSDSGSLSDEDIDEDRKLADKASKSATTKIEKTEIDKTEAVNEDKPEDKNDEKSSSDDEKSGDSEDEKKPIKSEISPKELEKTSTSTASNQKKKKGKSYDYATKLNYLFRDARFFLVKSNNAENVTLSKAKGVWSTPPTNESRLNKAFEESRNVLLIFSVKESGKFSGFARLASESRHDVPQVSWVLPPGLSARALGGVLKIDWICRKDLPFQKVQHLYNPWNDGKPIKIGRDGQEIEPKVAEELCRLFSVDDNVDMTPILRKSKESARRQRGKPSSQRKPISGSTSRGPISGSRDRFPGPPGGGRGAYRKRRFDDGGPGGHYTPHYSKYGRYSDYQPQPYSHYSRGHSSSGRSSSGGGVRSYEEYLRNTRYANEYSNGGSAPPPQYYSRSYPDRGYYPDYPRGDPGYVNYDRRVDDFLKHTSSSHSGREYDRRYRERR